MTKGLFFGRIAAAVVSVILLFGSLGCLKPGSAEQSAQTITAEAVNWALTDDYPANYKAYALDALVDEWHYYNRECTSFVAWRLNSRNGVDFHNWYGGVNFGNAGTWGSAARSIGITVDMNPAPGSVFWQTSGQYGHVAWVNTVNGDGTVTIEEYNWLDAYGNPDGAYHNRTVSVNSASGYIHIKDIGLEPNPHKPVSIPEGRYLIVNVATLRLFNYGWLWRSLPRGICASDADNSIEQIFFIKHDGDLKYEIQILHGDGGVVNSYCASPGDIRPGVVLTRWDSVEDDTQRFYFCQEGDHYYIAGAGNKDAVIAAPGNNDGQLFYQSYTGAADQQWKLVALDSPDPNPWGPVSLEEGIYQLRNVGTGRFFNYGWLWRTTPHGICESTADGTIEQKFRIRHVGDQKYEIQILHENGGVINSYCGTPDDIKAGVVLTRWDKVEDDTQRFCFCRAGSYYYITSAANRNVCVAAPGAEDGQLVYQNYADDDNQKWELIRVDDSGTEPEEPPVIAPSDAPEYDGGIDVSAFQGVIDWDAVAASGIQFAVIRCATTKNDDTGYVTDEYFEANYEGAVKHGLKVGVYFYTAAATKSEMKAYISNLLKTLSGKQFDLPVYLDSESASHAALTKEELTEVISYGCSLLRAAGYQPGVYACRSWYQDHLNADSLRDENVDIWMAAYPYSNKAADPADYSEYADLCSVWQYSDKGSVAGISTNVDVDVRYKRAGILKGDVNLDDTVDVKDAVLLARYLGNEGVSVADEGLVNADIDGRENLSSDDLTALLRIIAHIIAL